MPEQNQPTRDRFGVWYMGLGTGWLCDTCFNAKPSVLGGRTCTADPIKIAQQRTCRQYAEDPFARPRQE
jgi:hypothetical protein